MNDETTSQRRLVACFLAVASGVFLLISGNHGPTGTYNLIMDLLQLLTQNQAMLQTARIITSVLTAMSLAGGLTVIIGGIIILINHVTTGRILIGLGSGAGILMLIILAITLITTQQIVAVIAEYSTIGWIGILLAFIAIFIAK